MSRLRELDLESTPRLRRDSSGDFLVADGGWYYLEWHFGDQIGNVGGDNPDLYCSPYDRMLLQALSIVFAQTMECSKRS